jgi:hypothetical protein
LIEQPRLAVEGRKVQVHGSSGRNLEQEKKAGEAGLHECHCQYTVKQASEGKQSRIVSENRKPAILLWLSSSRYLGRIRLLLQQRDEVALFICELLVVLVIVEVAEELDQTIAGAAEDVLYHCGLLGIGDEDLVGGVEQSRGGTGIDQ